MSFYLSGTGSNSLQNNANPNLTGYNKGNQSNTQTQTGFKSISIDTTRVLHIITQTVCKTIERKVSVQAAHKNHQLI